MLSSAMAPVGSIIGLPMFLEIGLVLLMPVIYLVIRRSQLSLITVGRTSGVVDRDQTPHACLVVVRWQNHNTARASPQ